LDKKALNCGSTHAALHHYMNEHGAPDHLPISGCSVRVNGLHFMQQFQRFMQVICNATLKQKRSKERFFGAKPN
jgi:hypothetical protein